MWKYIEMLIHLVIFSMVAHDGYLVLFKDEVLDKWISLAYILAFMLFIISNIPYTLKKFNKEKGE